MLHKTDFGKIKRVFVAANFTVINIDVAFTITQQFEYHKEYVKYDHYIKSFTSELKV